MKKIGLILACLVAPMAASAHDFDYTFAEGGYVNADGRAEGPFLRGSYEWGDSGAYAFGQYTDLNADLFNLDIRQSELGLGYAHSVHERVDVLVEFAYQQTDTALVDLDGYRISLGARIHLIEGLDGLVRVNHFDGGDYVSDESVTAGLEFKVTDDWSVVGESEFNDEARVYQLGARYSF